MRPWPEWPQEVLDQHWTRLVKRHGAFHSVELLGSTEGPGAYQEVEQTWQYVAVRLRFVDGEAVALLTFNSANELEMLVLDAQDAIFGSGGRVAKVGANRFELTREGFHKVVFDHSKVTKVLTLQWSSLILAWQQVVLG